MAFIYTLPVIYCVQLNDLEKLIESITSISETFPGTSIFVTVFLFCVSRLRISTVNSNDGLIRTARTAMLFSSGAHCWILSLRLSVVFAMA